MTKLSNGFSVSKFNTDKEVVSAVIEADFGEDGSEVENYDKAFLEAYLKTYILIAECLGIELVDETGDEIVICSQSQLKDAN
jgi:hypothetical protein